MSGPMTRTAYRQLIDGNLRWLNSLPRTLEREHIKRIVEASEAHEYDDNLAELETLRARVRELEKVAKAAGRLVTHKYLPWAYSGGDAECMHGVGSGIYCQRCDELLIQETFKTIGEAMQRKDK